MKFLVDSDLPPELCVHLRDAGHDAIHIDAFGAEDNPSILTAAVKQGRIAISRDRMLEIERQMCVRTDLPIILLQDLPEEPAVLGSILCAALTPTAQAAIAAGTITYIYSGGITCSGVRL